MKNMSAGLSVWKLCGTEYKMENKLKYMLGIIIAVIVLLVIGYFIFNKQPEVHSSSSIKSVITKELKTTDNTFTIEQISKIKRSLTDSLRIVYGKIIDSLLDVNKSDALIINDERPVNNGYNYISEIDSQFVVKDDSGAVMDLLNVKSTFISPEPLSSYSLHMLRLSHKSFRTQISSITTRTDTIIIKENSPIISGISIRPNVSYGYGLRTKQFDFYAGIGLTMEFDIWKLFF